MVGSRMRRDSRRRQLLDTAATIVRAEGTDALTLARLAEQAGVTKPIAYEHFGTRAGLLIALYRHFDERQAKAVATALANAAKSLDDAVSILSAAYVDCVLEAGPEFGAIAAALSASEEMDDFRQALRDGYVDQYRATLGRFVSLPDTTARPLMLGLIGAADVLAQDAAAGRLDRADAIAALSRIMLGALSA